MVHIKKCGHTIVSSTHIQYVHTILMTTVSQEMQAEEMHFYTQVKSLNKKPERGDSIFA